MTSENDVLKTNEFLRRRKLRLQQVREQSKDIAKKIRQRAKVEKLRHVIHIDSKKEKEYLECQEKLVKRLELLYSKNLQNVGTSHKQAVEVSESEVLEKVDLSKLRGKEAVAELRKQKQEKLDEQKKLLDRKLQAREAANEISREKSSTIAKNLTKQTKKVDQQPNKAASNFENVNDKNENKDSQKSNPDVTKTDMATQWDSGEVPNEWVPNVPELLLPKESATDEAVENTEKLDKNKRPNLFALSDEMPSSLRGGLSSVPEQLVPLKSSLTLVSEYLQNRNLRLRQFEPIKKPTDDLQSIKQTILRTRASRTDGSVFDSICHVLDKQVIPVPSWHAEKNLPCNCQIKTKPYFSYHLSKFPINNLHGSSWSNQRHLNKFPELPSRINNLAHGKNPVSGNKEKSFRSNDPEVSQKKSITIYNHNTRDIQDVPYEKEQFVSHERRSEEDAYSQALQETASASNMEKEKLHKKQQDMRNRIAVTKQNVDKEYRDTLAFLNSISKDKDCSHRTYVDDQRRQIQNEKRQRQMQQEFKKIEKECHKQNCKHNKRKPTVLDKSRSKSKSPVNIDEQQRRNFEYSWMPVPESDDNFAIHTLPTTTKTKSGNTVKFSEPNSYHEYRSRHKHTPPTKDVNDDRRSKKIVETVIVQQNNNDDESVPVSETSSVENMSLESDETELNVGSKLRDADRIIIYKILDSKTQKSKSMKKHKNAESILNKGKSVISGEHHSEKSKSGNFENKDDNVQKVGSFEQLQEGVYKGVSSNGDNITSINIQDEEENIESHTRRKDKPLQSCACGKAPSNTSDVQKDGVDLGVDGLSRSTKPTVSCHCGKKIQDNNLLPQSSVTTSATSFKTAPNDKTNVTPDTGFLKLIDEGGSETGKFYIGASGFIKDDNYEVVIQLRKKEGEKNNNQESRDAPIPDTVTEKHGITSLENKQSTVVGGESNRLSKNVEENLVNPPNLITNVETSKVEDNNSDEVLIKKQQSLSKEKNGDNLSELIEKSQPMNMCEKAVHTSFNDSYAIPVNLPKTDPLPRPATSTYTQTSFNSSIQRPPFLHMTSSTSTAYMSPPELILPNFLKHDYVMTQEELFESVNSVDQSDPQYEVVKDNKDYEKCSCKRCIHGKKASALSLNIKRKATSTPPNTARSSRHCRVTNKTKQIEKKNFKCHKCRCSSEMKICHKTHRKRTKSCESNTTKEYLYENKHMKVQPSKNKIPNKNKEESNINPIVKNYVNKLLDLNREGLKAVEIINQECSTASTPGSSIINIPTNKQLSSEAVENKISLEQIKNILKQQILEKNFNQYHRNMQPTRVKNSESQTEKVPKLLLKGPKKKSVHKVKSLNISRQLLHKKKHDTHRPTVVNKSKICTSTSSSTREEHKVTCTNTKTVASKSALKDTSIENSEYKNSTSSDIAEPSNKIGFNKIVKNFTRPVNNDHMTALDSRIIKPNVPKQSYQNNNLNLQSREAKVTATSSDSEVPSVVFRHITPQLFPTNTSTQTKETIDVEQNFLKVAEDKLQNMEKIADLTEKCTKRLSNLAKVLEEVRRNKSLVYSQISTSDSASESENKADKNITEKVPSSEQGKAPSYKRLKEDTNKQLFSSLRIPTNIDEKKLSVDDKTQFIPFLIDIPKPTTFNTPLSDDNISMNDKIMPTEKGISEPAGVKVRGRPPPALSRINLKKGSELNVTPHELSTVLEVDSPMSLKLKNQSSRQDTKIDVPEKIQTSRENEKETNYVSPKHKETRIDPDLLQSNVTAPKVQSKVLSTDSSDESKIQMIDLKQFNNIMLQPFITLQEYAKQCNFGLEEGSNVEDVAKGEPINEDLSSLHSDGSLPDVIAELLKRNIISEPFKFDTASNANSSTMSSESTLSMLALSKSKKKKSGILSQNKENVVDTSETLSISSNPDLENAFQKLGMGWASSTLKKTKERLALSSSTNTSSSSLTQFKIKPFSQVMPILATDSTSSLLNNSNDERKKSNSPSKNAKTHHKNAVQQTSLTNSMTVKEFLTNELANKITFSNKSARKDPDEEFISLYETNMPDELKNTNIGIQEDGDQSTLASNNVRARTSTPVQIFKSTTYKSTSSSNTSNGLFSNADDLSSVKGTSNSIRYHSTSDKDDLTIPNYSLKMRKDLSDFSKSD